MEQDGPAQSITQGMLIAYEIKKKLKILIVLAFFLLPVAYASTINNTNLESTGLNSTINITFLITFDELIVTDNSIAMHNLTYNHPDSCNLKQSTQNLFNYTTINTTTTSSSVLSSIACPIEEEEDFSVIFGGRGSGEITPQKKTIITKKKLLNIDINFDDSKEFLKGLFEKSKDYIKKHSVAILVIMIILIIVIYISFFVDKNDKTNHT